MDDKASPRGERPDCRCAEQGYPEQDCKWHGEAAQPSDQPPSLAKATDDKQEWRVIENSVRTWDIYSGDHKIADDISLKATAEWICAEFHAELAAERQLREQATERYCLAVEEHAETKLQLLSALAAIEGILEADKTKKELDLSIAIENCNHVDLSSLREHDAERTANVWKACEQYVAEVRKPLVEALREALLPIAVLKLTDSEKPYAEISPELRASLLKAHDAIMSALAKVKEGNE
jgi:hypothetical protein